MFLVLMASTYSTVNSTVHVYCSLKAGEMALASITKYLSTNPPVLKKEDFSLAAPITGMDKVAGAGVGA